MIRTSIDLESLREMLEQGASVTVLDVRPEDQRTEWRIPGSVHFDAYGALKAKDPNAMKGAELPEGQPVVTVCSAGNSSAVAAEQLRDRGFKAYTLEGEMKAWSMAWNTAEVSVAGTGARVIQVRRTGKGCLSYLVGSGGEAAVIDASLDPGVYIDLAERYGWKITCVLDTHVHADHLSRSRGLAELFGATPHMPEGSPVSYAFSALGNGDEIRIGSARLEAVLTPGHTPESMSYLLEGRAIFTGDTLFLSTVGRPDLEATPEAAREKAHALFGSVRRLLDLAPHTLVLPGHTSEPVHFDGKPICAPLLKVHEEVKQLLEDEDRFVEKVAGRLTPTPENYERIVELNRAGEEPEGDPTELEAGANRCAVRLRRLSGFGHPNPA
ncbi:MAG: MBL fold metallo-hydrolase [Rubrobacteraceae bacterium]|nr:MBL fold metallo-hydrolase [Rubrobacter sp.]MBA3636972.1 MBL fold metallo-hydrolase [Rubrobacteraceae bacterium]